MVHVVREEDFDSRYTITATLSVEKEGEMAMLVHVAPLWESQVPIFHPLPNGVTIVCVNPLIDARWFGGDRQIYKKGDHRATRRR